MKDKMKEIQPDDFDVEPLQKSKSDKVVPVKLTENSRFKFRCHKDVKCFTACCSNINIVLPPYDLLRLRKRLGMTTEDFISEPFCRVDDAMRAVPKHAQASPWPSEVVTLGGLLPRHDALFQLFQAPARARGPLRRGVSLAKERARGVKRDHAVCKLWL